MVAAVCHVQYAVGRVQRDTAGIVESCTRARAAGTATSPVDRPRKRTNGPSSNDEASYRVIA